MARVDNQITLGSLFLYDVDVDPSGSDIPQSSIGDIAVTDPGEFFIKQASGWEKLLLLADVVAYVTSITGTTNGLATLTNGRLSPGQIPDISITDTFVVASQAAMLALTAETGDIAIRTDIAKTFILKGPSASTLSDWVDFPVPAAGIISVNGLTGTAIALTTANIAENTNLYYTNARGIGSTITAPTLTNSAIATGDSIQIALGKLQAQINSLTGLSQNKVVTTRLTSTSNSTLTAITALQFSVTSGRRYLLEVFFDYKSVTTSAGLATTVIAPAGAIAGSVIYVGNAGDTGLLSGNPYTGNITSSGDVVASTNVESANTNMLAMMTILLQPTANGTITPQFRSSNNGQQVSIEVGTWARLTTL